jgi:ParB family chromosome partitioning protein
MILDLALDLIDIADNANGRAELDDARAKALANQLEHEPLLHPITVRRAGERFQLIAGRHRLAAFSILQRTTIPVHVVDADDLRAATLRLAENVSRSQISPVEEATQLATLVEAHPNGVDGVARDLARPVSWILDRLDIMAWPSELIHHVHAGRIKLASAKILARIPDATIRDLRIHDAATHGCSARTAQLWLQTYHHELNEQPNVAENAACFPSTQYLTETRVLCFACKALEKLERTHTYRICNACTDEIARKAHEPLDQSPMLTPPVYDPPPPQNQRNQA